MADSQDPSQLATMTFELLKRMQAQMDRIEADIHDFKVRMSAMEATVAQQSVQIAALSGRMDRFDERMTRIEKRLDLTEA